MDAETASVIATIIFNLIVGSIVMIIFEHLRNRQIDIYLPKTRKADARKIIYPKAGFLSWIIQMLTLKDEDILSNIGLDAYMTLRYIFMCFKICAFCSIGAFILLFVYVTGAGNDDVEGIDTLSMANIYIKGDRLWASLVFAYMFIGTFLYFIYFEYDHFVTVRRDFLRNGDELTPEQTKYTIQLENIPAIYRTNDGLKEFLEQLFPNEVLFCHVIVRLKPLDDFIKERDEIVKILEKEYCKLYTEKKRPMLKLYKNTPAKSYKFDSEIDSIVYWSDQLSVACQNVAILQSQALSAAFGQTDLSLPSRKSDGTGTFRRSDGSMTSGTSVGLNQSVRSSYKEMIKSQFVSSTALVTLASKRSHLLAVQSDVLNDQFPDLYAIPAPSPTDFVWENMHVMPEYTNNAAYFTSIFYYWGLLFWGAILAFIAAISNLSNLTDYLPFIANLPLVLYSILEGILPVLVNAWFSMLIPMIMTYISTEIEGRKTHSSVQYEVFRWYFKYQLASVYLLLLTGSIFDSLSSAIDDPLSIVSLISSSLPSVSVFFINVTITQVLSGIPLSLLKPYCTIVLTFYHRFYKQEKLTRRKLVEGPLSKDSPDYGTGLPEILYYLCIVLLYWVLSPIVVIAMTFLFLFTYVAYKYKFLFVVEREYESGGFFWFGLFNYSMTALLFSTITLITYFGIKEGVAQGTILFPMIFGIIYVWRLIERKFENSCFNISLRAAVHSDTLDQTHTAENYTGKKSYQQNGSFSSLVISSKAKKFDEFFIRQWNITTPNLAGPYPYRVRDIPLLDKHGKLDDVYLNDELQLTDEEQATASLGVEGYKPPTANTVMSVIHEEKE